MYKELKKEKISELELIKTIEIIKRIMIEECKETKEIETIHRAIDLLIIKL